MSRLHVVMAAFLMASAVSPVHAADDVAPAYAVPSSPGVGKISPLVTTGCASSDGSDTAAPCGTEFRPLVTTFAPLHGQGLLTVGTSSVALSGLTTVVNSPAWPTLPLPSGGLITLRSRSDSPNRAYVCAFGGSCSSTGVSIDPGQVVYLNIGKSTTVPTIVSEGSSSIEVSWS